MDVEQEMKEIKLGVQEITAQVTDNEELTAEVKKQRILAIKDTDQRQQAIAENMELFMPVKPKETQEPSITTDTVTPTLNEQIELSKEERRNQILAIKDDNQRQRTIAENLDLF